ncbi:nitroreductase [Chloroflexota bacterium]
MDIQEAINQRKSIRAFKSDPVPLEVLREIMGLALRAPSWGNTQPWEFAIVGGRELDEITGGFIKKIEEEPNTDIARPQKFPEPYITRRRTMAAKYLEAKGIQREDRERRGWWRLQQLKHFGALSVVYIYIDRSLYFQADGLNVWPMFDCGLVAENIMLLSTGYGLGTIPQAQSVIYPDILRKVLGIPDSKLIVLGIAIGYPDWDDPVNQVRSEREPLDRVAKWYGFD